MPFTCAICSLDINVGERLLSDETMNLAHETCVLRLLKDPSHSSVNIPSAFVSFPPPPAPPPPHPLPDARKPWVGIADLCAPSPQPICVECQKPAIGMCPHCKMYVHQDYGYNGPNCSGRHETRCEGARRSRDLEKLDVKRQVVELPIESVKQKNLFVTKSPRNGRPRPERKKRR